MFEIKGKHTTAIVYTDQIEETAIAQITELCNQEFMSGSTIRIMPDTHAGAGCTIGTTMTIADKVCPNLVGVDIGCGVRVVNLGNIDFGDVAIDFKFLDDIIRNHIPCGRNVHEGRIYKMDLTQLRCYRHLKDAKRLERSIGTLGGGNHFIEVDVDSDGNKYLIIHSGSRNLGHQVATYYQKLAVELCSGKDKMYEEQERVIAEYKAQGRRKEIQEVIKDIRSKYAKMFPSLPEDLCYLTGKYKDDYLHDMKICQEFAVKNREVMARIIVDNLGVDIVDEFETTHNYINFDDNILRKGAISARLGEKVIIPINMRDGALICVGKGNPAWNYSAPHGAGRLMSRNQARQQLTMEEYQKSMDGIYTTSVDESTLDEAAMAYKPMQQIIDNIGDTVDIVAIVRPIYNFKASE